MLHDPSHITPVPAMGEIILSEKEKDVLRRLGAEAVEIGRRDAASDKAALWKALNDRKAQRPMVWINEIPWHEMNVADELVLVCGHPWARDLEDRLRKTIYQAKHMPCDMIVDPFLACPKVFHSTDFGILEKVDTRHTDADSDIYSRHFEIQIKDPEDIEKIQIPKVTYYEQATAYALEAMEGLYADIGEVRLVGQTHIWFTPWDYLIRWWGVAEAMVDLVDRPEMVHRAYERMVDAWSSELDQIESLNLLSLDNNNTRIGSGGYGYVSDLPGAGFDENHVRPIDMWGCSNAQIFTSVSPEMHWEFAIEHDMRWLARFGLTYYGCCEALDGKIDVLRRIPNLRKISVSPWCDIQRAVDGIGTDYVMSRKPSPSVFVGDAFHLEEAERQLRAFLDCARGCHVELIMKDISTVTHDPKRLWDWAAMAMRVVEEYAV
ncbi:MAG: hypothetical protein LBR44_08940 [Clostridiales Family XIII bacterium]|jgi:hypothetical protein|nr:hypothetical protein [Clostridiales Family XIII bacterium]